MIYADHAATTPVDERVVQAMLPYMTKVFGNPSGIHTMSQDSREALEEARELVAKLLGARRNEVVFTGGGSEANNLALRGLALANRERGNHIITSAIEHHAVLEPCHQLEREGFEVTYLSPDSVGIVPTEAVLESLRGDTVLVSMMLANNEVGTLQPVAQIGSALREREVLFHTDAVQAVGKIEVDFESLGVDALSLSAHKFFGPKGVGALLLRRGVSFQPQTLGGGQERGLRSGTQNVAGIIGLAKALELTCRNLPEESERLANLRDRIIAGIARSSDVLLTGHRNHRLPGLASFAFAGTDGESLVILLDRMGVAASTGSACSSATLAPSHVLGAMRVPESHINGSLRISLGSLTKEEQIDELIEAIQCAAEKAQEKEPTLA